MKPSYLYNNNPNTGKTSHIGILRRSLGGFEHAFQGVFVSLDMCHTYDGIVISQYIFIFRNT